MHAVTGMIVCFKFVVRFESDHCLHLGRVLGAVSAVRLPLLPSAYDDFLKQKQTVVVSILELCDITVCIQYGCIIICVYACVHISVNCSWRSHP